MTTDITEKGLVSLIMRQMTGLDGLTPSENRSAEMPCQATKCINLFPLSKRGGAFYFTWSLSIAGRF